MLTACSSLGNFNSGVGWETTVNWFFQLKDYPGRRLPGDSSYAGRYCDFGTGGLGFPFGSSGFGQPRGLTAVAGCFVGQPRKPIFPRREILPRRGGTFGGSFDIGVRLLTVDLRRLEWVRVGVDNFASGATMLSHPPGCGDFPHAFRGGKMSGVFARRRHQPGRTISREGAKGKTLRLSGLA